jgi:RNA polymerase sigma-70 factor (ECF subfamily)
MSKLRRLARTYERVAPMTLRRARRILGNDEAARDVVQDVFVSLLAHQEELSDEALVPWLYRSTTNLCLNRLRDDSTRATLLAKQPSPARSSQAVDEAAILRDTLRRLPADLKAVAFYYYADEMTHDEIASVLGCSRRHVGNLVQRLHAEVEALETLR